MIVLDGARMEGRAAIHAELREKLSLPEWYGANLDALNDCLGERAERELIVIENAGAFLDSDEAYAARTLRVFADNGIQVILS